MAKKKNNPILNTKDSEELGILVNNNGLRLGWIKFIDAYIENGGNAVKAYLSAYPKCSKRSAYQCGSELLRKPDILLELNNRLQSQRVTDELITAGLLEIATEYRGAKTIMAAVKSFEILAKMRGLLVDTKKIAFTGENPAVFLPVYSDKEKKEFDKIKETKQRIVE